MPAKIRFLSGVPEEIALEQPDAGVRKHGLRGPEMCFTCCDGRVMYVPEEVAQQIFAEEIQPGQCFWLTKHMSTGIRGVKHPAKWDLSLEFPSGNDEPTPAARMLEEAEELAEQAFGPLPPIGPERAIAEALDEQDRLMELMEESIRLANEKKAQAAVSPDSTATPCTSETQSTHSAALPQDSKPAPAEAPRPQVMPRRVASGCPPDIAFEECVRLVQEGLRACGENWGEEARQKAVVSVWISLTQAKGINWGGFGSFGRERAS